MAGATSYRWPNDARLALSLVVNVEEGSEYSLAEGDAITEPVDELAVSLKKPVRNYGNESNYRYGINEGHARIAALLDRHQMTATYTAAALSLERAPEIAAYIRRAGHEACSHGWRWIHQFRLTPDDERDFIRRAALSIEKTTGQRPLGWLSRYLHTADTRRLLQEEGFLYHMDDYSADAPFWAPVDGSDTPMIVVPYQLDTNDMKMWLAPSYLPQHWLDYAIASFDQLYQEGAGQPRMMSLGLHLRIIGRPGRIAALDRFLAYVGQQSDVWVTTRRAIAEHFSAAVKPA
jgi:peptidoglycan/xylan/chitin deacetylase (PgdA/CDA1 family)